MSEPLKVGDRVRVFADTPADEPIEKYLHYFDIGKQTGTVTRATKNGYIVRSDDGLEAEFLGVCMELIERPRRTFEEIIDTLIVNLNQLSEENDYGLLQINTAGTAEIWYEPVPGEITYYCITKEGEFGTDDDYTFTPAAHLAAIAAACTEIAANWEAEHGKEEA